MAQSMDFMGPVILWNLNVANKVTISNDDEMAAYSITFPVTNVTSISIVQIAQSVQPIG